jgi:hypothetical protein
MIFTQTPSLRRSASNFFRLLALTLAVIIPAHSQTFDGGIRGSVSDQGGAPINGAIITLTDEATHQVRETNSDTSGSYAFNALKPSTYDVRVSSGSFAPATRTHIVLDTQDFLTLDISLTVGNSSQTIQVSAEAPLIDSSAASISTDLDQRRLEDLPVLGRNPYITAKLSGVFVNTGNPQFIRRSERHVDNVGSWRTSRVQPLSRRWRTYYGHKQPTDRNSDNRIYSGRQGTGEYL